MKIMNLRKRFLRGTELVWALNLLAPAMLLVLVTIGISHSVSRDNPRLASQSVSERLSPPADIDSVEAATADNVEPATERFRLDATQSKFIAHASSGGLLWFKGHDHLVAVREFTGEAQLTPESITPASLALDAKSASMVETSSVFTDQQKQIINKELREIVLLPDQYPDITFKSTNVSGKSIGNGQYDLRIGGELTLHGVTRPITIPTKVTVTGNDLRAQGEFDIDRSDFKVKATSAVHGLIRVRDKVKFTFDIVGHQF